MMMVEQMLKNAQTPLLHIADVSSSSSDEPESNSVCPKCGNTGRCEPRTLSDPDGQECDCGANCC